MHAACDFYGFQKLSGDQGGGLHDKGWVREACIPVARQVQRPGSRGYPSFFLLKNLHMQERNSKLTIISKTTSKPKQGALQQLNDQQHYAY